MIMKAGKIRYMWLDVRGNECISKSLPPEEKSYWSDVMMRPRYWKVVILEVDEDDA
jgi:hypothetical protein